MESLDPRVRFVWVVGVTVSATVLGAMVTAGAWFFRRSLYWVGPALAASVVVAGGIHAFYRFRRWRFELQDDALYIERGVITQVRTVVPYVRVQHVDARRGPTERIAGLAKVVVYTAGSRQADVSIPGLTPDRADALQERLRRMAIESEPEDAV